MGSTGERVLALAVALALLVATGRGISLLMSPLVGRYELVRPVLQLLVLSAGWLLVNSPYEGRVLWASSTRHGLTVGDTLCVPPLVVALALAVVRLRG